VGVLTPAVRSAVAAAWRRARGHSPLAVSVEVLPRRPQSYLFEAGVDGLGPPPPDDLGAEGRRAWADAHGGVDAYTTVLRIVVDGRSATAVTLTELCIRLVRRGPPPVGALLEPPGAGAVVTRYFEVDLDEDPPTVKAISRPKAKLHSGRSTSRIASQTQTPRSSTSSPTRVATTAPGCRSSAGRPRPRGQRGALEQWSPVPHRFRRGGTPVPRRGRCHRPGGRLKRRRRCAKSRGRAGRRRTRPRRRGRRRRRAC
jgi:hypothetical protein